MKKRLICMLLTVLMVVSLFAGASVSANAETVSYSTMTYRMASGDYVLRICQRLGLNYYVCKTAIMKLNNIQEGQWNKLPVGKLLTLPATDADAVVIATGHGSTAATQTAATTVAANSTAAATLAATTPSSSAKTTASASGDVIWWWIVPYQLRSGETVAAAMNSLGMSASQYWDTIQKINKIKDWGSSRTDTSILLPTVYPPASGFSRVTIYAHRMLASETPANVVASRGLDYNKIKPMLDILNEKYGGVAKVQTGERLFYPIASTGKVYGKDRVDGLYGLFSGLSSDNGTVEFYVNGERVYQAKAGETVTYVIKPAKGKAVKDIVLKLSNGQGDMYLNGSSFVMPASDVTLDASFQSGHTITLKTNYEGKAAVRVDGVGVDGAAKGAMVMVVSTDPSLAIDELYVNYTTLTGAKREQVTNIDQGFVMPDYDVTVEAFLKPVPTYSLFIMDNDDKRVPEEVLPINTNGRFSLEVEGAKVTSAARGAEVKIVPDADTGFTVGQIWVFRHNTIVQIGVFNNTFVMPNVEVDVGVRFVPKGNNIRINPVEGGQFYATIGAPDATNGNPSTIANRDANAVDEAGTNVPVYLNWIPDPNQPGYNMAGPAQIDLYDVTRNSDGLRIPVTWVDGAPSFRMPAGGATVTGGVVSGAQTYTARVYLDGVLIPNGQFKDLSFYTKGDGAAERSEFQDGSGTTTSGQANVQTVVGEYIALTYNGGKHITLARYEVWDAAEANMLAEETNQAKKTECFKMPNQSVVIHAYFVSDTVKIAAKDIKVNGSGTVGMLGQDPNNPGNWISVDGVKVGEPFALSLSPSAGYFFNNNPADGKARIKVTRKDNGGDVQLDPNVVPNPVQAVNGDGNPTGEWIFYFDKMPDESVSVEVTFDKIQLWVQLVAVDEVEPVPNQLNAAGSWKVTVNNKDTLVENILTDIYVDYDDTVTISLTDAGSTKYSFVKSIINSVVSTKKSFTLSGELARAAETLNQQGQPLNVTVVLRSNSLSGARNPIALKASVNDVKRGSVGFAIINASPDYQRPVDPLAIATEAYARDTVAIIPQAVLPDQYMTDAKHIRVNLNGGGYIEPTGPVDANGDGKAEEYTFVMPEGGYSSIKVDFVPVEYTLTVNTDPANAEKGLFRVTYSDGSSSNDVLLGTSFKNAAYGSTIKVVLTDAGKKAGVQIDADKSITDISPKSEKTSKISGGFQFTMPAGDTTLKVYLRNADDISQFDKVPRGEAAPGTKEIALPASVTDQDSNSYTVSYAYEDSTVITGNKAMNGKTVVITIHPALPKGKVLDGNIVLKDNVGVEIPVENGGSFTVPDVDVVSGKIKVKDKQYVVTIETENAKPETFDLKFEVERGGSVVSNFPVTTPGAPISPNLVYGDKLSIDASAGKRNIKEVLVNGVSTPVGAKTASGITIAPSDLEDGAAVTVKLVFEVPDHTLTSKTSAKGNVKFFDGETEIPSGGKAAEGKSITVKGDPANGDEYATEITVTIGADTKTVADGDTIEVTDDVTAELTKTEAKKVDLDITYKYADGDTADPSGRVSVDKTTGLVKDDLVQITKADPADLATIAVTAEPASSFIWTSGGYKVDTTDVTDGTIKVTVTVTKPTFELKDGSADGNSTTKFFLDAEMKNPVSDITKVTEGTKVFVQATPNDDYKYVTAVVLDGTTLNKQSSGAFGPFEVKEPMSNKPSVALADKVITIEVSPQHVADQTPAPGSIDVQVKGANRETPIPNVTKNGNPKVADVSIVAKGTTTINMISGKGITEQPGGKFEVDFSKYNNGDTVTVIVYVTVA